ncbi:altered inheritance of mitochondria protein 44-like isoform X4 [Pecten maximus]|uniref:altered inheritance of mitochondria protein 44-like isoform X4 n=1 Tax=Pecten maximus TaxID=6579 RepID=UPI001458459A|nr:altered inheritance of mitochondria protein 44-like isoform X4 [Pecten maximus]
MSKYIGLEEVFTISTPYRTDVQAAERIFRKVVHPGLDSMRIVDRNGAPITSAPSGYTNYLRNKAFTLSPRGVPTRISNHVYSGQHTHVSRYGSSVPGSDSPEMYVMQASNGVKSAKLNRPYTHSSILPSRKRAMSNTSKATHSMQTSRTTSGRNATKWYFDMTMPGEKRQMKSAQSEHWNKSEQGQRLNREWSSVSDSRALKRSSEILSHRVDRMYFMNGNNIRLQPKYHVDEEELLQLRDASKSRQSIHHPRVVKMPSCGPSSRMSSHRGLNSGKSKASVDQGTEKTDRAKSLENIMTTRKMDNEINRGKSPLHGWDNDGDREEDLSVKGEIIRKKSFHEDQISAGINESASVTHRSDKASVKNEGKDGKDAETVEDEFDKPERADGRQNPEDVVNTDNNVVAVDDKNEEEKNDEEKDNEEDENWKIRKTEEEEKKRLNQSKEEDNIEGIDERVDDNEKIIDENTKEDDKEKDVVQNEGVSNNEQEAAEETSKEEKVEDEVSEEKVNDENADEPQ